MTSHPGSNHPYDSLTPDVILNAVELAGFSPNGSILALNSYENRVYRIGLESGVAVVVKFYRPDRWSDATIIEEHQFCYELADVDVPVALPVRQDNTSLFEYESFRFSIYEWQPGHAPEVDQDAQLEQLGRLIARIHAVGAKARFSHRQTYGIHIFEQAVEDIARSNMLPDYLLDNYHRLCEKILPLLLQGFEFQQPAAFRRIHGDFHIGNVLVRDERYCIVDLDDACNGPAVQDLWMLLSGQHTEQEGQLNAILKGYLEFYDFDFSQLYLIEELRTIRLVHYAAWLARRWSDSAFPRNFPWFNTPRYWEEHVQALQEQLYLLQNKESFKITF